MDDIFCGAGRCGRRPALALLGELPLASGHVLLRGNQRAQALNLDKATTTYSRGFQLALAHQFVKLRFAEARHLAGLFYSSGNLCHDHFLVPLRRTVARCERGFICA